MSIALTKYARDLDRIRIGWPWHGLLQQVSDGLCTLTSPTGEVVNFPLGDTSHAISAAVAKTSTDSWRYGICQRYVIPGLPVPTTTPAEQAAGMTWQNTFIKSGIAYTPGGGDVLIDEDNKVWRTTLIFSGYRPSQLVIWHGVAGAWAEKMRVAIADPGFVAAVSNLYSLSMTSSSTGRLRVYSIYEYATNRPTRCWTMNITGRVNDGSLAVSLTRLMDSDISGATGTTITDTLYSGTATVAMTLWQMESTRPTSGSAWGPFVVSSPAVKTTFNFGGPFSNSSNATPGATAAAFPPAATGSDLIQYTWTSTPSNPGSGFAAEEAQQSWTFNRVDVFAPWSKIGYFIGTDDQLVAVYSYSTRTTTESGTREMGYLANTYDQTRVIDTSAHATIGGRTTIGWHKVQTIVRNVQTGVTTSDTTTGGDGAVHNLLQHGFRAVCVAQKVTATLSWQQYVAGQFFDAPCFQKFGPLNWPLPLNDCPKFSIHPTTGAIAVRATDGRPISWV